MANERAATVKDLQARKLFKDVPGRTIKKLLSFKSARFLSLEIPTQLMLRRNRAEYLYIVVSGYLEVRLDSQLIKSGESFLVAFRGPEHVVGEMRTIAREPGVAAVKTSGPCELIEIPSEAFTSVAKQDWRIYRNLVERLAEKTFQERKRIEVILMPEGVAQVAQALLNFLHERGYETDKGKEQIIRGVLRHTDIADYIGCHRTTVTKRLRELKRLKIIDYPKGRNGYQQITICNLGKLTKRAQEHLK
jgi:CRP-like cAMP-binding protein